jgi:hypothetical protein
MTVVTKHYTQVPPKLRPQLNWTIVPVASRNARREHLHDFWARNQSINEVCVVRFWMRSMGKLNRFSFRI